MSSSSGTGSSSSPSTSGGEASVSHDQHRINYYCHMHKSILYTLDNTSNSVSTNAILQSHTI